MEVKLPAFELRATAINPVANRRAGNTKQVLKFFRTDNKITFFLFVDFFAIMLKVKNNEYYKIFNLL